MEKGHKLQALLFTSIKVSRIHFFRAQIETFYYPIQLLIKKVALRSPIQYHLRIQYYVWFPLFISNPFYITLIYLNYLKLRWLLKFEVGYQALLIWRQAFQFHMLSNMDCIQVRWAVQLRICILCIW